ncbi:MAG: hypothetical protein EOM05_11425, partial [Clostridia bacterium]|nr:hypothetical protein [Clostridia bacterium]
SYAMMVYSAAGEGFLGESAQSAHDSIQGTFDSASDSITSSLGNAETTTSGLEVTEFGTTVQTPTVQNVPTESSWWSSLEGATTAEKLTNLNTAWSGSIGSLQMTLKWTAIAEAALSLAYPPKEEYIEADKLMKSWMGSGEQDAASLAYVQCMASIGLSFPNLASWSAGDKVGISQELASPMSNPLRLTDQQVSILIAATSEKFVKTTLLPIEVNSDTMTYIALSSMTYYQVGQVLCGGKLAVAQNLTMASATPPPSSGGGANEAMIAAKLVISMLPPPYNLIASLILDIITSFESGNACTDEEIAMKWGMDQFKTNQHLNFNQCHYISTSCAAKWFWGGCMRKRNHYCCYDQIVTRVMMEGIKPQLGKDWSSCNDISINDLKNISFQPCAPNQDPYLDKCFPADKFNEFQTEMTRQASKGLSEQSMQDVVDQAINSMAVPGKNLSEICKDCNK